MYFKEHKRLQKAGEQQWMEGIQFLQLVAWNYVTSEKNGPLDQALEDTSPSGHIHISRKARG